jgi:Ran GTPase-activating protein (RanGAP) involved in mRNA processing and transport
LKEEVPTNLRLLCQALIGKPVSEIDFSHNAFGPSGMPSFDFYLEQSPQITNLSVVNGGLGPEGGKLLATAL